MFSVDSSLGTSKEAMMKISEPGPEADLLPDLLQIVPIVRDQPRTPDSAGGQSGADDGDDAGDVEHLFAREIDEVGQSERKRDLRQLGAAKERHQRAEQTATDEAKQRRRRQSFLQSGAHLPKDRAARPR